MIKRPDCLMSDNGKYCITGTETMIKNTIKEKIKKETTTQLI